MQILDEHRHFLGDERRIDLFRRAIKEVVRPGMVVADVGSGTGVLGLLALQAGASRVHAIEPTGLLTAGVQAAAANGFADRYIPHEGTAVDLRLPEPIDVCLGDFIGCFGFDASLFDVFPAARRLLRAGGILLPSELSIFVAPVEHAAYWADVGFWSVPRHGLSFEPMSTMAQNAFYIRRFEAAHLLAPPISVATWRTGEPPHGMERAQAAFHAGRDGTLHGLAGWFEAQLSPLVTMTNSPLAGDRIARSNVFLPLNAPLRVSEGDRIEVRLALRPVEGVVNWRVGLMRGDSAAAFWESHSTLQSLMLSRGLLRSLAPDRTPRLTPRGRARLAVLQACDGTRTLSDIEELVWTGHSDLFPSRNDAARFVAGIVATLSEP